MNFAFVQTILRFLTFFYADGTPVPSGFRRFAPELLFYALWIGKNILMIVLTVLLLGVWLPLLIVSVRKALRKDNKQLYTDENK
jgi:hypothetical protein